MPHLLDFDPSVDVESGLKSELLLLHYRRLLVTLEMGPFEIRWEFSAFVLGTFFLYLLSNLSWTFNDRKLFRLLPVVGVWRLVPARGCTLLRSIFGTSNWALNGYTKVSIEQGVSLGFSATNFNIQKHISRNVPYIMPSIDRGPVVVLPPSQIRRFYNLPEEELDAHRTSNESIQTSYTIQDQHIVHHPLHFDIIRHKISRNLDVLTQPIATELDIGFRRIWGLGTEWRDIPVWQSCMDIIAGAANAALSGYPLCEYYLHAGDYTDKHTDNRRSRWRVFAVLTRPCYDYYWWCNCDQRDTLALHSPSWTLNQAHMFISLQEGTKKVHARDPRQVGSYLEEES